MPPLFEDLLDQNVGKLGGDFHNLEDTFPAQQSRPQSGAEVESPVDSILYEVSKLATTKLDIPRPTAQDAIRAECDLFDGKRLLLAAAVRGRRSRARM